MYISLPPTPQIFKGLTVQIFLDKEESTPFLSDGGGGKVEMNELNKKDG